MKKIHSFLHGWL